MTVPDLRPHTGEEYRAKVIFVQEDVRPPLDDPDLCVEGVTYPNGNIEDAECGNPRNRCGKPGTDNTWY